MDLYFRLHLMEFEWCMCFLSFDQTWYKKKQQKKEKPNPNPILLQRYTNLYYGTLVYYNEKKT